MRGIFEFVNNSGIPNLNSMEFRNSGALGNYVSSSALKIPAVHIRLTQIISTTSEAELHVFLKIWNPIFTKIAKTTSITPLRSL